MSHSSNSSSRKLKYVDPATFTPHFAWEKCDARSASGEEVVCERVPLEFVARKYGTPTYVYSRAAIKDAYEELHSGLGALPHTLCFAVKSNGNLSILDQLAKLGSGFDIVSGGELHHLQRIGVRGERIVFSGVGKDRYEIREALNYRTRGRSGHAGILLFNAESQAELDILVEEAARLAVRGGRPPAAAIRVNPDVQAGGHPHIATGRHEHKFGLDWPEAKRLYLAHRDSKWICRRVEARANRVALPGCWGRAGSALFGPEATDTDGVRTVGFANGAQAWRAPVAGAWAFDHRSGRYSLDARRVYENESRQDVCGCGFGDERLDAAGALRGDSSHNEDCARREGECCRTQTSRHCGAGLRDGRLLLARLAARGSEGRRATRDLGCGSIRNVASVKL